MTTRSEQPHVLYIRCPPEVKLAISKLAAELGVTQAACAVELLRRGLYERSRDEDRTLSARLSALLDRP